jgi:hypothetical protein
MDISLQSYEMQNISFNELLKKLLRIVAVKGIFYLLGITGLAASIISALISVIL